MYEKECVPFAPSLIESMRSLGYSFQSAIADLLDNSISAGAKTINIITKPGNNPTLAIIDDGCGMTIDELYEAMRYGSSNPLEKRDSDDLGRFGLGLKSASLSQCRKLTVVSKKEGSISGYSWDLDYVIERGSWMLKGFDFSEAVDYPDVDLLSSIDHGTYVLLDDFDRIAESTANLSETFTRLLDDMIDHISLVFHRFLEEGLKINVNGYKVEPRDPFLRNHRATQVKRVSSFTIDNAEIVMKPYILPHISKLSLEDLEKIGGKEKIKDGQGFYVYRNKRLIIYGTWFRLERKDELNKLARIMVDIPNTLDYMWSIDIKKSSATLPEIIKRNMYNAVIDSVATSETVHTYRGRREKNKDIAYIWERNKTRDGYEYVVNRDIPQIKLLADTLDDKQLHMLDAVLNCIEKGFPVGALYVDAAKGNIFDKTTLNEDMEKMWEEIQVQIKYVKENGLSVKDYYNLFLNVEPYCRHKEITDLIKEELKKYEEDVKEHGNCGDC